MFDIGAIELLIIAIVAIIVVGPRDLPVLLRKMGGVISYIKKMSAEFQSHIRETVEDTGIQQVKDTLSDPLQYDWTDDDEREAEAHNENIMRQFDPETDKPARKTTKRKAGATKTTPRKTKTVRKQKPRTKGARS